MAIQSSFYSETALDSRTFPSTKHIATKPHMAVWRQQVSDDVWVQMNISDYQLINNSCVLNQVLSQTLYKQLEVRVADAPDELATSPSDVAIVASIATEIEVVADISDEVVEVATGNYVKWVVDTIEDLSTIDTNIQTQVTVSDVDRGGSFTYDATLSAINNGVTIFDGWVRQYNGAINVKWGGAKGDGIADDTAAIQLALDIGFHIFIPSGTYNISEELVIYSNTLFVGTGSSILQKSNASLFYTLLTSFNKALSNVTIRDIEFIGSGVNTADTAQGYGIDLRGTSEVEATAPINIVNILIENCKFSSFQAGGIFLRYIKNFSIINNLVTDNHIYGIHVGSGKVGTIKNNTIKRLAGLVTAYGITMTSSWNISEDTIKYPRSEDIICSDNFVEDVENWTGIDTHGGKNIKINNNTILNCHYPIGMGKVDSGGANNMWSTTNSVADKNYIVGKNSFYGIGVSGGAIIKGHDNKITNNTLISCGNEASVDSTAIYIANQEGTLVSGNTLNECAIEGIQFNSSDNFICTDNTIKDVYSDLGTAKCIDVEDNSWGIITNNRAIRDNTALGTSVSEIGVVMFNADGFHLGDNDFERTLTPYIFTSGTPMLYPTVETGQDTTQAVSTETELQVVITLRRKFALTPKSILVSSNRAFGNGKGINLEVLTQNATSITVRYTTTDGTTFGSNFNLTTYYQVSGY